MMTEQFLYTDMVNNQVAFVRSEMPISFKLYYNKLDETAFKNSDEVPIDRVGSLVFLKKIYRI